MPAKFANPKLSNRSNGLLSILILLIVSFTVRSVKQIPVNDLKFAYQSLLDSQAFCRYKRAVIISDKPVYKAGETAYFAIYYYNLLTKYPLSYCKNNLYNAVTIYDVSDKYITSLQSEFQNANNNIDDIDVKDYSVFYYAYEIPKDVMGGVYVAKISGNGGDEVKFLVMTFANRRVALVGDWNADFVRTGDILKGKLTFKILTTDNTPIKGAQISFSWFDQAGKEFYASKDTLIDGLFQVNFLVPEFFEYITFTAQVSAGDYKAVYKKDFLKPKDDDIVIDFNIATGKLVKDMSNKIYFQAFINSNRIEPLQIKTGRLTKTLKGHTTVIIPSLASDELGKGMFEVSVFQSDLTGNALFELEVRNGEKLSKYLIFDLQKVEFSPVLLKAKSLYYKVDDILLLDLSTYDFKGAIYAVIQNKGQILAQRVTSFDSQKLTFARREKNLSIKLSEMNVRQGGVITVQLYTDNSAKILDKSSKNQEIENLKRIFNNKEANINKKIIRPIPPVYTPPKLINYQGTILQEIDIFIEPAYTLCSEIQLNQPSYLPGSTVQFSIIPRKGSGSCYKSSFADFKALIIATDESAFLEVEKGRESSSLFTKIFLEREILTSSKTLRYSQKYIDPLFNTKTKLTPDEYRTLTRNVEFLLGNGSQRKFLFDPAVLEKYIQQPYDISFNESRNLFEYLVPTESSGFVQPVMYKANFMMRAEQVMAVAGAPPMMEMAMPMAMNASMSVVDAKGASTVSPSTSSTPNSDQLTATEEDALKRDTIYHDFKPMINEVIKGEFKLPDRITNFALRVIIFSPTGIYGYSQKSLQVRKPINISTDVPLFIYKDEEFKIPVTVENNQAKEVEVVFQKPNKLTKTIKARNTASEVFSLTKNNVPLVIEITDKTGNQLATYKINPQLVNPGILAIDGVSGYISTDTAQPESLLFARKANKELIKGNNKLEVCYRNGALGIILEAIKEFNRIPTGCFEQASTTTFPIIVALKLLKRLPQTPEIQKLIADLKENLKKGIKLLLTYECKSGGFEWFGTDPGHSTLTAYGLWQFYEIAEIDSRLFDSDLLKRLQTFVQSQKDKTGGFFIRQGLDALGNPEKLVSDIYILYVLSKGVENFKQLFTAEYEYVLNIFKEFKAGNRKLDSYKLAVIGLLFFNTSEQEFAREIAGILASRQNSKGGIDQAETSITRSSGESLEVETTALTLLLLLNLPGAGFKDTIDRCLKFISENLKKVYYQSTQATILSLFAIDSYLAHYAAPDNANVSFNVAIENKNIGKIDVSADKSLQQNICLDLNDVLLGAEAKDQDLKISVAPSEASTKSSGRYFFEIRYEYYSGLPNSNPNSPIDASITKKIQSNVASYAITIKNLRPVEQGMTIIEFNRPSCFDFNINDLEALRQKGDIAYYELKEYNKTLVFYFRGLKAQETKTFNISLVKRFVQTSCQERAHMIYLYYDKEGSMIYRKAA